MEKSFKNTRNIFSFMVKGRTLKAISTLAVVGVAAGVLAQQPTFDAVKSDVVQSPAAWKVVIGADAKAADVIGAAEIASALTKLSAVESNVDTSSVRVELTKETTKVVGEVPLYKDTAKLYLGDNLNKVYTVVSEGLVFGSKKYKDTDNKEYDYTLKLYPGSVPITFDDRPDTTARDPSVFVDAGNNQLYTLEVRFYSALNTSAVKGTEIELFGKKYYFDEVSGSSWKLREAALTSVLRIGEAVEFEGKNIQLVDVVEESGGTFAALVKVDGATQKISKGQSVVVSGVDIYVRDAYVSKTNPSSAYAELVIGGKLIELNQGSYARVGGNEIKNVRVQTANNQVLILNVRVSEESAKNILLPGQEFVDPLFGTFKLVFGSVNLEAGKHLVRVEGGNYGRLSFVDYAGRVQTFDMFKVDSSNNTVLADKWTLSMETIGGNNYLIVYNSSANPASRYFVVVDNNAKETYVFEVVSVDTTNNKVRFREVLSGREVEVSYTGGSGTLDWAGVSVNFAVDEGTPIRVGVSDSVNVINPSGSENITFWGKDGYKIVISFGNRTADSGETSGSPILEGVVSIYEPDDNTADVEVILDNDNGNVDVHGLGVVSEEPGENNYYYALTTGGTYVRRLAPTQSNAGDGRVEIYVAPEKVAYDLRLVPTAAAETVRETKVVGVGGEVDGWKVTKITGLPEKVTTGVSLLVGATILDTEVTYADRKLIVVGGPAVNRVAAELLGVPYPSYGEASGIPENAALLKVVEQGGRLAVLVAGWEADNTRAAARVLAQYLGEGTYAGVLDGAVEVKVTGSREAPVPEKVA